MLQTSAVTKNMLKAVGLLMFSILFLGYSAANGAVKVDLIVLVVSSLFDITFCSLAIFLIGCARMDTGTVSNKSANISDLGVWGYFWRGFLALITAKIVTVILIGVAPINIQLPSIQASLIGGAIQLCIVLPVLRLFYSKR